MAERQDDPTGSRTDEAPPGLAETLKFPLIEALLGRRSRRFPLGGRIPDGPLAYTSRSPPVPLSELEQLLLVTAVGGNTGWHYLIARNEHYAPYLSSYAGSAGGRTFPSAAGFETTELFYTDDSGIYFVPTRDTPGPYRDTPRIRGSAWPYDEEFKDCVTLMAQYLYDTYGKFPPTLPSMYCLMFLQAQHLDREFYDHYFQPGAYLRTHAEHLEKWHPKG